MGIMNCYIDILIRITNNRITNNCITNNRIINNQIFITHILFNDTFIL